MTLASEIRACRECSRCHIGHPLPGLRQSKPGKGVLFVYSHPSYEDDLMNEAFSCRHGAILKKKVEKTGFDRVMFTYLVKCYSAKTPRKTEVVTCSGWLEKEITNFAPAAIVPMGKLPVLHFVGREIYECAGQFLEHPEYPGIIIAPWWGTQWLRRREKHTTNEFLSKLKERITCSKD